MKSTSDGERLPVVFVVPGTMHDQQGPLAAWLNTAGWAAAAKRLGHSTCVITRDGILSVEELREFAVRPGHAPVGISRSIARRLPVPLKVVVKDIREWRRARTFSTSLSILDGIPDTCEFVWQRHELFHRAGLKLAKRYSCPLVVYVAAPKIWEAGMWGVKRPGWGSLAEHLGERQLLREADLVACISDEVADVVVRMGVEPARTLVTPSTVDTDLFSPDVNESISVRSALGLSDRLTVGWVGSFRPFHGLDVLLDAFVEVLSTLPSSALLLVGEGPERARLMREVERLGIEKSVLFVGAIPQAELPPIIGAMDIAVAPGLADTQFHYSPLKLWEYLAMCRPVIAPRVGLPQRMLQDGHDAILVQPGEPAVLAQAILRLASDPDGRLSLGRRGRTRAMSHSSTQQFERVRGHLQQIHTQR